MTKSSTTGLNISPKEEKEDESFDEPIHPNFFIHHIEKKKRETSLTP